MRLSSRYWKVILEQNPKKRRRYLSLKLKYRIGQFLISSSDIVVVVVVDLLLFFNAMYLQPDNVDR